jgi:hypothetical protein
MFISSLEHFSQCTEGDVIYREGEDNKGFQKALSLLKDSNSVIFLTVPFGFHKWQPYHQNYDWNGILKLTKGSSIIESYTYRLIDDNKSWKLWDPKDMTDVFYTDKAYGVGCFVLKGE